MKQKLALSLTVLIASAFIAQAQQAAPKEEYYGAFRELSITSVKPEGWLKQWLVLQKDGLTGNLEVAGYPYNTIGWNGPRIKDSADDKSLVWNYEQYAYWVDGMVRAGYQLEDKVLLEKGAKQLQYVLGHPDAEGFLPPAATTNGTRMWYIAWPHTVLFRGMMATYSATGDQKIIDALHKNYSATIAAGDFDPKMNRHLCAIEIMSWLYGKTGDRQLMDKSLQLIKENALMKRLPDPKQPAKGHGVTYNEMSKQPAIVYLYTGDKKMLETSLKAYEKLKDDMLIDGCHSAAEHLIGNGSRAGHEVCDIIDYSWSVGYLLMATGDGTWADRIERATFNAGIGSVTKDFKAHQYFSGPNQVLATHWSNHLAFEKNRFAYRPGHDVQCCTGNINRCIPNYIARMWMTDGLNGIVAALFGPSRVVHEPGGQKVTITEKTDYPFSEQIEFQIQTGKPVKFPLILRIPGWCETPSLTVNGKPADITLKAGTFARLDRSFSNGDKVVLSLPMKVNVSRWPDNGLGVERGPLVYSLFIDEKRVIDKTDKRSNKEFPAWDITPASPWNYALDLDIADADKVIKVVQGKMTDLPFNTGSQVVELRAPARLVKGWELEKGVEEKSGHECLYTPELPSTVVCDGPAQEIRLVPLGSTCLRLSIFPSARELPSTGPQSVKKGSEFKEKPPTQ